MRAKNDFQKKTKNSFIFFQIGLIATMLIVLVVLEFNFKDVIKKTDESSITFEPITDDPFFYTPAEEPKAKPIIQKALARVEPKVDVSDVIEDFKLEKDKIIVPKIDLQTQDDADKTKNPIDTKTIPTETTGKTDGPVTLPNINTVEQLPMFKACQGLRRSEQKACFDEQLSKAISRNLVYPENDFDNRKQGTALIEFIIDEDGNITNVKPLENNRATEAMKKAAEKAVKRIPQLIPAMQGNKNVRIKYAIPITFKIN